MKILVNPNDKRYIFLTEVENCIGMLTKHLNKIPQYQLLPNYRGIPRPEVFLDNFVGKSGQRIYYCSIGLWKEIYDFCIAKKIACNKIPDSHKLTKFNMTKDEFKDYVKSWGMNIEPRDYQYDAAWMILKYQRSLSELATRAGKTLIFNMVARTALEKLGCHKILMVVPSIHLVKQGVKDLDEYTEYFKFEQIWAGGEQVSMANLTIGTFQSLVKKADPKDSKYDPEFFKDYDMVCIDECHKLPCASIKTILNVLKNVKLQFGFSGTLPKPNTIEWLCCQALMGPKIQTIEARDLIDEGFLAEPIIKQFRLKYNEQDYIDTTIRCAEYLLGNYKTSNGKKILLPKDQRDLTMIHEKYLPTAIQAIKKQYTKEQYCQYLIDQCRSFSQSLVLEQMLVQRTESRIQLMVDIINNVDKNIVVFAHNTEYIAKLVEAFTNLCPNKKVYKITGNTSLKKRQETLDKMLESNNNILVGSYGAVGTGLTFKNLDYGIFAQSFKSEIINNQSLGRIMLRTAKKPQFYIYDIIDVFPTKKIYNQGLAKVKSYKEHGYKYEVISKNIVY